MSDTFLTIENVSISESKLLVCLYGQRRPPPASSSSWCNLRAFLGDRALNTSQLADELDDVPVGSLYRHISILVKAGVLQVVGERRVRGAVERTYTLRRVAAQIGSREAAAIAADDHARAFMVYIAGLLADSNHYLASGRPDPAHDGAAYRMAAMWLTDSEFAELVRELAAVFQPRLANTPGKTRRRRILYTVLLPSPEPKSDGSGRLGRKLAIGEEVS